MHGVFVFAIEHNTPRSRTTLVGKPIVLVMPDTEWHGDTYAGICKSLFNPLFGY